MTLQERQKRVIVDLKNEIADALFMGNYIKAAELIEELISLKSDPETYFKNIDEEE